MIKNIQTVNFENSESLREKIEEKLDKLRQIDGTIISGSVYLKKEHNDKIVEIDIELPNHHSIFVKKSGHDFTEVINDTFTSVRRQVVENKEK